MGYFVDACTNKNTLYLNDLELDIENVGIIADNVYNDTFGTEITNLEFNKLYDDFYPIYVLDAKIRNTITSIGYIESELKNYGTRDDGSIVGLGYFGELYKPDNTFITEALINVGGQQIPALVPTLTDDEIRLILSGAEITQDIIDKASAHAQQRILDGLPIFAQDGEQSPRIWMRTFTSRLSEIANWLCIQYYMLSQIVPCTDYTDWETVYVDKNATGDGTGTSLENAYTTVQQAINENTRKIIRVKGYGKIDPYPESVNINKHCTYIVGFDDVWFDLQAPNTSINGAVFNGRRDMFNNVVFSNTRVENINILKTQGTAIYGFRGIENLDNCSVEYSNIIEITTFVRAFTGCKNISNCSVVGCNAAFFNCKNMDNCEALNCSIGYERAFVYPYSEGYSMDTLTDCNAENCTIGFNSSGNNFIRCNAINCTNLGFRPFDYYVGGASQTFFASGGNYIDCSATGTSGNGIGFGGYNCVLTNFTSTNNENCGYFQYPEDSAGTPSTPNTYISCIDSNNCTSGDNDCTPEDPDYKCDDIT